MVALSPQDDETAPGLGTRNRPLVDEVIALVADWGAAAMPENEDVARALRPDGSTGIDATSALERARVVVARAGPLLPAELVSRLGEFEAIELGTPAAPAQVRVRLALWWNEVEDVLAAELSNRRATVAADLAPLARNLEAPILEQSILAIGSGLGALDATALLDRIEELVRIRNLLADPSAVAPVAGDEAPEGPRAAGPEQLEALREVADTAAATHRGGGAAGLGPLLGTASGSIRAHLAGDGAEALTPAAADAWHRALCECVDLDRRLTLASATACSTLRTRAGERIAASRREVVALPEARRLALEQELQAIEREVERSEGDLPALAEVVYGALRRLDTLQQSLAEAGIQASLELRASAADLETLLSQDAARLPVALITRARNLLDRVPACMATDPDGIPGLRSEIIELRNGCSAALDAAKEEERQQVDALRTAIEADLARALDVAPKADSPVLRALRTELGTATPERLHELRDEARNRARRTESALRRRAVTLLRRSERSHGKGPVTAAASAVRSALDADDLPRLRDEVDRLAALVPIPWWTRPELVGPLVAIVLILLAIAVWLARPAPAGELPVEVALTRSPGRAVSVALVRDGRVEREETLPGGEQTVPVTLAPGRYEIYIDRQFTGRSFTVPGSRRVEIDPVVGASR